MSSANRSVTSPTVHAAYAKSLDLLSRTGTPQHVIIIGAGLAGLSAGYQLIQAGHSVTILEARTRAGGRVHTIREPLADGLYAEAGAFWIPDHHNLTLHYVRLFDLPLVPIGARQLLSHYYVQERHFSLTGPTVDWPFALTAEEERLGIAGMFEKYLTPGLQAIGDATAPEWPSAELARYDQMTFADYLRSQGASDGAVDLLGLGYFNLWGEGIDSVSALFLLRDHTLSPLITCHKIKGGNDLLPRALAGRLQEHIFYGAPVVRIEQHPHEVRVVCAQAGQHELITGDHLICAVPFSVLRHIEVAPAFSPDKQRAIAELPHTSVVRIFLQSRRRFWLEQGFSGYAATDLPLGLVGDTTHYQPGTRGLLESYMTGAPARRVTAMAKDEQLQFALEQLERVYPGLRQYYEGGVIKCWDTDEWTRGDYIWMKPGQMQTLLPHIARPEGRIHFAGDHTSPLPGWMQGALFSGHRAAREVHMALAEVRQPASG